MHAALSNELVPLQYRPKECKVKAAAEDTVGVHYEGVLIDGTVFDSSYKRNQPNGLVCLHPALSIGLFIKVIKGWHANVRTGHLWHGKLSFSLLQKVTCSLVLLVRTLWDVEKYVHRHVMSYAFQLQWDLCI